MSRPASSVRRSQPSLKALNRRAEAILQARPAYKEMVDFYLTVFRRQIEWRDRLAVHPEEVTVEQARECLRKGTVLGECYDPGIASESLLNLWAEMKEIFRRGNDVLRRAMEKIDDDEKTDGFVSAAWLTEQRPDRSELVADAARQIGIDESVLATLVRAVTFPHWERVAQSWLPPGRLDEWKRFRCPTCGGVPGLADIRAERNGRDGDSPVTRRLMHCPFCGSSWPVPTLDCPNCGSTKEGDAKYFFTADEPEWRIDFCKTCQHYVKVIDGEKVSGPIHVGLELLTATHLDVIAQAKSLRPLEACA